LDSRTPELDSLYRDVLLDHYRTPRGRAAIADPDVVNEGQNPLCGDVIRLELKVAGNRIGQVHVHGKGCSISVASGSMLAELVAGKSEAEAERLIGIVKDLMHGTPLPADLETGDLDALEGIKNFPVRVKCALLPWTTLEDALKAHAQGRKQPDVPTSTDLGGNAP